MDNSDLGFKYFQEKPIERFRVPDKSNPWGACAALLAFAAYPSVKQHRHRQRATDALQAWLFRAAIESGDKIKPPPRLSRKHLSPALMRSRVYAASRRFEFEMLDLVGLGMDISFFRSDGPGSVARLLGGHFEAEHVTLTLPHGINQDLPFLRDHLKTRKSKAALAKEDTLKDFRRRIWKTYLPALPLAAAIHVDCLKFDFHKQEYGVSIPGYPKRYLAISILCNPQLWIDSVVQKTRLRRVMMVNQFPPNTFAEILGEQEAPSWLTALEAQGY